MLIYKILNKSTGLYSLGGGYPKWSKFGKTWSSFANLNKHLSLFDEMKNNILYDNCVIVEYDAMIVHTYEINI